MQEFDSSLQFSEGKAQNDTSAPKTAPTPKFEPVSQLKKPNLIEKFDMQHFAHLLTFRVICRYTCSMDLASVAGRDYEEQGIKDVCFGNKVSARTTSYLIVECSKHADGREKSD